MDGDDEMRRSAIESELGRAMPSALAGKKPETATKHSRRGPRRIVGQAVVVVTMFDDRDIEIRPVGDMGDVSRCNPESRNVFALQICEVMVNAIDAMYDGVKDDANFRIVIPETPVQRDARHVREMCRRDDFDDPDATEGE